jgi:acetyl esterase/lipase
MIHRYGEHPSQYAELREPAGEPRGVVVVVHGGFWKQQYGLEWGRPLAQDLAARGWLTLNLEYRRVGGGGGLPATTEDVAAGVGLLPTLGLDPPTVVALGHSAGGHLATWVAGSGVVTAVVAQAGVLDLRAAYDDRLGGGAVEALLGRAPTDADARWDPIRQVPLDVPVWCVHAPDDDTVPISQSRDYVAAARSAGAEATLVEVPGGPYDVVDPTTEAWRRTVAILDGLG